MTPSLRILLVDADPRNQELVQTALTRTGVAVMAYRNAVEVLAVLQEPSTPLPALIVMEPVLPDGAGFTLIKTLKADPRLRFVPIVALSCSSDPQVVRQAYHLGVNSYLVKAALVQELEAQLESMLAFWQVAWKHSPPAP